MRHRQDAHKEVGLRKRTENHLELTRWTRDWFRGLSRKSLLRLCRIVLGHPRDRLAVLRGAVKKGFLHFAFCAFCHGIYAVAAAALLAHLVRIVRVEWGRTSFDGAAFEVRIVVVGVGDVVGDIVKGSDEVGRIWACGDIGVGNMLPIMRAH